VRDGHVGVSGGSFLEFDVDTAAVAHLSGGQFNMLRVNGGTANVSGGQFTGRVICNLGGRLHLLAESFKIDGVALTPAITGTPPISGARISGRWFDGSEFDFPLNEVQHLVLSWHRPGDYTVDNVVDGRDFLFWQQTLTYFQYYGSMNLEIWKHRFGLTGPTSAAAGAAVPEPATGMGLAILVGAALGARRSVRRRGAAGGI
jgi:hypothetical protein